MHAEERKYPVLNTLSLVLKVLAVLVLVVGIISVITAAGITTGAIITTVLTDVFIAIVLYALADLILVVIDIEHNTFMTSQELSSRATSALQSALQEHPEGGEHRAA